MVRMKVTSFASWPAAERRWQFAFFEVLAEIQGAAREARLRGTSGTLLYRSLGCCGNCLACVSLRSGPVSAQATVAQWGS